MLNQGLLDEPVFSFWMGTDPEQGEAVFGGVDEKHFKGKIEYVPVRRRGYWEVELEKVKFGDETLELETRARRSTRVRCPLLLSFFSV